MWTYMLKISWRKHITSKSIREKLRRTAPLSTALAKRKLAYLGHILRGSSRDLMINITEGFIEGKACRGRRRRIGFQMLQSGWSVQSMVRLEEWQKTEGVPA